MAQHGFDNSLKQIVKNTFIEFVGDDEDPWMVNPGCRRQQTDSFLDRRRLVRFEEDNKSTDTSSNNGASSSQEEEGSAPSDGACDPKAAAHPGAVPLRHSLISNGFPVASAFAQPFMPAAPETVVMVWGDETTVMLRNIPCKYTQAKLMREINGAGFLGRFDFLYVPMDPRSKANRGFAFCNFDGPDIARRFYDLYHGKKLRHFSSDKVIEIVPADIQGFEANAEHYMSARSLGRIRNSSKPLFMRPLPPHLIDQDEELPPPPRIPFSGMSPAMATPTMPFGMPFPGMMAGMPFSMPSPSDNSGPALVAAPSAAPSKAAAAPQETRFCPYCGKPKQQSNFTFCPYCGHEQPACP